ncbi:MAG: tRNA (guanosine(46)-N7)-methyltransferase TrmB [Pseudomonadota bacterium]
MMSDDAPAYIPRLYGRRQDKPLKPRQARAMGEVLPRVAMPDPASGPIDLDAIFPNRDEVWLEIGFGGGEHLAWQAEHRPDVGMIGAEPFVNGVAKLVSKIDDAGLENIRVHFGDARPLIEALPAASIARLFVLHPDPWPKKKHHKRRMISPWFLGEAARLIRPGGELRVASDIRDYIRWTLMHMRARPEFEWTAARADDWRVRPDDWPETRYETKARREGRVPSYLRFRRI